MRVHHLRSSAGTSGSLSDEMSIDPSRIVFNLSAVCQKMGPGVEAERTRDRAKVVPPV
jgi:hypothetical protein